MIAVFVIVAVLAFSVYDYLASRDWQQMTSASRNEVLFRSRNRRYGAYEMRKSYNRLMATLIVGTCVLAAFSMGVSAVYHAGSAFQVKEPKIDTTMLSLVAPPLEHIETLPESAKLAPAQQPTPPAQQAQPKQNSEPQDNSQAADPTTPTNNQPSETTPVKKKDKSKMTPEERARAFEEEVKASMPGNAQRAQMERELAERKAKREKEAQEKKNNQKTTTTKKTEASGAAVVTFNLEGRTTEKQGEDIPIPAYMCRVGGTVRVNITVLSDGRVVPTVNDANADPCLISEALKYAKKAHFIGASSVQRGWIEYKFHQQ